MGWEEMDDVEAMLEAIWDLHDKISDAIHSICRSHFLKSIKTLTQPSPEKKGYHHRLHSLQVVGGVDGEYDGRSGFVFVKEFRIGGGDDDAAMAEARSLNAIRNALENLEDQLEFFHSVQSQQRAERDAALARLKQSRIILALRLADHQRKKYKVIEQLLRFVSGVHEGHFVAPETLYEVPGHPPGGNVNGRESRSSFVQMLIAGFALAKNSLRWERMCGGGVLGNAALFAISMLSLLQLHQVAFTTTTTTTQLVDQNSHQRRIDSSATQLDISSQKKHFDVFSARG
ncbi:plastid division protein PDV1 [Iris pallida]|uniref:Plastid division protein PDV1 n=1 Tax=Iris pallida TaxID=29817 RepID=A0AAX6DRK4_IRIPA|nr:plastid division protein PDV1 [Iris pallida]